MVNHRSRPRYRRPRRDRIGVGLGHRYWPP